MLYREIFVVYSEHEQTNVLWETKLQNQKQVHTKICKFIVRTVNSVAPYMLRPPIVAIFREVFFEGYIT